MINILGQKWQIKKWRNWLWLAVGLCLLISGGYILLWLMISKKEKEPILTDQTVSYIKPEAAVAINDDVEEIKSVILDIGGAVKNPGVYVLPEGKRLADLIKVAGGFETQMVDIWWLQKNMNLAGLVIDGNKYYVPYKEEVLNEEIVFESDDTRSGQSTVTTLISINKASLKELTQLSGIGEVKGQAIIDGRPYTKIDQLLNDKIISEKIFNEIKNLIAL